MKLNLNSNLYLCISVFILYTIGVFIVGYNHEPWADEAQAWLIARDNSFYNIFFENTRYEGHPFVWFYLLKFFNSFNFIPSAEIYKYLFVIPWIFSVVGVYLFIFKSPFPTWLKCIFPFTFYIFYQYGVIARNHSIVFPVLAIIACMYEQRFKHPFLYCSLLFIFANINAFCFPVALILAVFYCIDLYIKKLNNKKNIISVVLLFLCLIFIAILMQKPENCIFPADMSFSLNKFKAGCYVVSSIFYNKFFIPNILLESIGIISMVILYLFIYKIYCNTFYKSLLFIGINFPTYLLFFCLYSQYWHYGYIYAYLIFSCWLIADKETNINFQLQKKQFLFPIAIGIIIVMLFFNIRNTYYAVKYDVSQPYCASKEVAEFIKKYNLTKYPINAYCFRTVSINPYFEKNIFHNYSDYSYVSFVEEIGEKYKILNDDYTPIIIYVTDDEYYSNYQNYIDEIKNRYYDFIFDGSICGLNFEKKSHVSTEMHVLIDKNIANDIHDLNL